MTTHFQVAVHKWGWTNDTTAHGLKHTSRIASFARCADGTSNFTQTNDLLLTVVLGATPCVIETGLLHLILLSTTSATIHQKK